MLVTFNGLNQGWPYWLRMIGEPLLLYLLSLIIPVISHSIDHYALLSLLLTNYKPPVDERLLVQYSCLLAF